MDKKALIIGLGVSGLGAATLLHSQGYEIFGFEDRSKKVPDFVRLETDLEAIPWSRLELVILSPGIPPSHPVCARAVSEKIEVIGELELSLRHMKQKAIAITGTNGKTTVTLLTTHLLVSAGISARALGNVGTPLSSYLVHPDENEVLVIELSSYQLETIQTKAFLSGIILNITPDHLDRYGSMEPYAQAKCRLQECLQEGGKLTIHQSICSAYGAFLLPSYQTFGFGEKEGYSTTREEARKEGKIIYAIPDAYRKKGRHDLENILAAWILVEPFGITSEQFIHGLQTFETPAHRIEFVAEKDGITFYDDSKGTNLDAVVQAVATMPGPVILIAGGVDKGASYAPWKEAFSGKVKKICLIGEAAAKIRQELQADFEIVSLSSLEEAVAESIQSANTGDCVLLSPGCASFDMFRDYAHRGEVFQNCVAAYREREEGKKV